MSVREIYDIAYKPGIFMFEGGIRNEGMIVPHYNVRSGIIEYYFIPSSSIASYKIAKERMQHDAHRYYGNLIPQESIKQALV